MRKTLLILAGVALPVVAHAATFPPNCNAHEQGNDATTTFCTTEYYPDPSRATAPNASSVLGDGLPNTGLKNVSDFVFATAANGGNVTSIQDVYNIFFSRSTSGDVENPAYAAPNSAPAENNGNYNQYGLFRTYAVGDTNNTLRLVAAGGLHFRNICSNNGNTCTQNNIWTAMIRPQFAFHPGQTLKFVYTSPPGCDHWFAMWQFTGEEVSGFNTKNNRLYVNNNLTWEFDTPDGYSTCGNNPSTYPGNGVVDGFPSEGSNTAASYSIFWPNGKDSSGNNWTYNNINGEQPWETAPNSVINTASGKHEYVVSWDDTKPTANVISSFLDGHLIHQHTFDFSQDATGNPTGPTGQPLGMQIIISQQSFSTFTGSNVTLTQSELKDFVLFEIAEFNGFISKSAALHYAPAPNGCGTGCP